MKRKGILIAVCTVVVGLLGIQAVSADSLKPSPVSIEVYASELFTQDDASFLYTEGIGGGAGISIPLPRFLFMAGCQLYSAESNNIWTDTYTILSVESGLGYPLYDNGTGSLHATFSYGLIAHWNQTTWYVNQKGEAGLRFAYQVNERFRPYIEGSVLLMFARPDQTMMYCGSLGIQYTI